MLSNREQKKKINERINRSMDVQSQVEYNKRLKRNEFEEFKNKIKEKHSQ